MPADVIMYGPESEPYNSYAAVSPAPGNNGAGGQIAQRGRNPLGQQLVLQDGRKYRFFLNNGSSASIAGDVQQTAVIITTDQSMTAVAAAIGSRIISFTHGGATAVINKFAEGYAVVSLAPGQGQTFKIASHLALTSGGTDIVNLAAGNAVRVALTTTSDISLLLHPYAGNLIMAATISGAPVGVAVTAVAADEFGWLQTRGSAGVRGAASLAIGSPAVMLLTGGTAGAVAPASAATQPQVGFVQMIEGTGEASGIFLTIDG